MAQLSLNEEETRLKTCAFTGHRPEKLNAEPAVIKRALTLEIDIAIADGVTEFITGMARGVDLWAAELVLERRKSNACISLFCAVPYEGFEQKWALSWQNLYHDVLSESNGVKIFEKHFSYSSFQTRNRWMVDHSSRVIAVYNGEKGGTKNTLDYARKIGIDVRILDI